jgi:hypothetical protein
MHLILRSFRDPLFQQGLIFRFELLQRFRRRHDVIRVGAVKALNEGGFPRIAFNNGGGPIPPGLKSELRSIEAEGVLFGFPRGRIGPVAVVAVFGKNRLDLTVERYRPFGPQRGR